MSMDIKNWDIEMEIKGQVPSKSNCYRIISRPSYKNKAGEYVNPHSQLGKTSKLKHYEQLFSLQIPPQYRKALIDKVMRVEIDFYYPSMRPDLDNSAKIVLDCLQNNKIIRNDNKVIELSMKKLLSKDDPRSVIRIKKLGV